MKQSAERLLTNGVGRGRSVPPTKVRPNQLIPLTNQNQNDIKHSNNPRNRSTSVPPPNSYLTQSYKPALTVNPYAKDAPTITLWTDGSCIGNYLSGIGAYFGLNHPLNISKPLNPPHNSGLAEITAAREGLRNLFNWRQYASENVKVCTDYLPMIRSLSFPTTHERFANEITDLRQTAEKFPRGVIFQHVYSHAGNKNNDEADRLARKAVGRGPSMSRSRSRSSSKSRTRSASPTLSCYKSSSTEGVPGGVVYIPPAKPIIDIPSTSTDWTTEIPKISSISLNNESTTKTDDTHSTQENNTNSNTLSTSLFQSAADANSHQSRSTQSKTNINSSSI